MKRYKILIQSFIIIACLAYSCKDNKKRNEIAKIVTEWTGKEILFSENIPCYVSGKDTLSELCNAYFEKDFKILMYVDSAGCSSCRLKLFEWKQLIEEADSLFHGKVGFLLFFQPKSTREITYIFVRDRFNHPVFMDLKGTMNRLNNFPQATEYQCFLLDKDNTVVMIGNPTANPKIWDLYKEQITEEKQTEQIDLTTAEADKTVHEYGSVKKGSSNSAVFTITNTGNYPLVISRVSASCGCTNVEWEKRPIKPGKTVAVSVEMTPDETGYFDKTIDVYCNIEESPIKFIISGNANE